MPGCKGKEVVQSEPSGSQTSGASESAGGLAKTQIVARPPWVSDARLGLEVAFLTSSQVVLMLLVRGPDFENHRSTPSETFPWKFSPAPCL